MRKSACRSVLFAVWLPDPFTVATWIVSRFVVATAGVEDSDMAAPKL